MNDDDRKAYIGEDAKHIDREHLYTAQEARIEQLKRETVEMPCHFFCCGKDRFGNECFAELKLVLDKHSKFGFPKPGDTLLIAANMPVGKLFWHNTHSSLISLYFLGQRKEHFTVHDPRKRGFHITSRV